MLRQQAAPLGLPPKNRPRRTGRGKTLTAVSILALSWAVSVGPALTAESSDRRRGSRGDIPEQVVANRSDVHFAGPVAATFTDDAEGLDRSRARVEEFRAAAVYNWSGLYLGGHAVPTFTADTGVIAGGHIGFNYQFLSWLVGLEASLSDGDLDAPQTERRPDTSVMGVHLTGATLTNSIDVDGLSFATARLGYARDRWLTYLSGGIASATLQTSQTASGSAIVEQQGRRFPLPFAAERRTSERHLGWTVGGGLEYALTPHIIFGLEYNLIDLGHETHSALAEVSLNGQAREPVRLSVNVDPDAVHSVWARLSFKFGCCETPGPLK
jgi:opacity protein-like surface antigen